MTFFKAMVKNDYDDDLNEWKSRIRDGKENKNEREQNK